MLLVKPSLRISLLCSLALVTFLSGCMGAELRTDIKRVERSVQDLRGFQAEQTSKIAALESQLREMNGRVEELEFKQQRRIGTDIDSLKQDLSNLKRRVPPPTVVPLVTLESDENRVNTMPSEIGAVLTASFSDLREGKFDDAQNRLGEALMLSRSTEWEADVLFWLGIAQEGNSNDRDALRSYISITTQYSKHKKAAAALLRQSGIFVRIGDLKTAKITLKKLIADFPKTDEADKAKERLKDLA